MQIYVFGTTLAALGLMLFAFVLIRRKQGVVTAIIPLEEIGKVYNAISKQRVETSFAVFIIRSPNEVELKSVEIQFSIEDGETGLDWILMSPPNIKEKPRVIEYAATRGAEWKAKEMNDG